MLDWGSLSTGVGSCRKTRGNPQMEAGNSWAIKTTSPEGKTGSCLLRYRRVSLEKATLRNSAILRRNPRPRRALLEGLRGVNPHLLPFLTIGWTHWKPGDKGAYISDRSASWLVWEVDTGGKDLKIMACCPFAFQLHLPPVWASRLNSTMWVTSCHKSEARSSSLRLPWSLQHNFSANM